MGRIGLHAYETQLMQCGEPGDRCVIWLPDVEVIEDGQRNERPAPGVIVWIRRVPFHVSATYEELMPVWLESRATYRT